MTTDGANAERSEADAVAAERRREVIEGGVMSFGDHLEELRSCSIRALVGFVIATALSLIFAKDILALVLKPALVVLNVQGQHPEFLALSPPDTFIMYLKMALMSGIILSMPWVLMQVWRFIAVGLYSREQRFIRLFAPISLGLFVAGVLFMFYIVLPVVINFFVTFSKGVQVDNLEPSWLQSWIVSETDDPEINSSGELSMPAVPVLPMTPEDAPIGSLWFDEPHRRFCVQGADVVYTVPCQPMQDVSAVRSQYSLGQYVSFVLMLSLGFGLAFELPLVVLFLTAMGICTVEQLKGARRYVVFGIFISAALLTPPDVISQVLLAIPMIVLFESALLFSKITEKKHDKQTTTA